MLGYPFTITSSLQLLVRVREFIATPRAVRLACLVLEAVEVLAAVVGDTFVHGTSCRFADPSKRTHPSTKTTKGPSKQIVHLIRYILVGVLSEPVAAHKAQFSGFQALDLLHRDKLVDDEWIVDELQEETLLKRQLVVGVAGAMPL